MIELVGPAFTIAMLGANKSLLSAVVADGMTGVKHDSNQELVGQGLANIVIPCLAVLEQQEPLPERLPTSVMTATNIRNGGRNSLAGIPTH